MKKLVTTIFVGFCFALNLTASSAEETKSKVHEMTAPKTE